MYTHSRIKKIDPNNPMKAPEYGIIEKTIQIGEKNRYSKETCKEEEWKLLKYVYRKIR